ncbi:MAG: hypothetical protein GJ680_07495 [Alteromonadaceae bacterium]|nr:hypothetical protein [Alteromonadaceae bacterium]
MITPSAEISAMLMVGDNLLCFERSEQELLELAEYMRDCDAFAIERGLSDAVGYLMTFEVGDGTTVNKGQLAVFANGLGVKTVDVLATDAATVDKLNARYRNIHVSRKVMAERIRQKIAELKQTLSGAVSNLEKDLLGQV